MTRSTRILYADPSPQEDVVAAFGSVESVRTLSACLSALKDGYDCVVVNPSLPDATGPAVVESIQEVRPGVPLMAWTDGTEALAGEMITVGADSYVPKSAGGGTLADRVSRLVPRVAAADSDSGLSDDLDDACTSRRSSRRSATPSTCLTGRRSSAGSTTR